MMMMMMMMNNHPEPIFYVNHQERGDLVELVKYELNDLQKRKDIDNVLLSKFNTYWNRMIDELNEAMQDLDCEPPVPSFVCQSFSAEALRYSVARNEILLPGYAKTVEDSKTAMGKVVNGFAKLSQQNQRMTRQLFKAKFTDSQLDNSLKALQLNSQMHSMSAAMIGGYRNRLFELTSHVDKLREVEYAIKTLNDKIDGLQCENQAVALCNREFRERIANYPGNEGESQMPISSEELVEAFREGFYENPLARFSDHA
ncbi:uncharacterized protein LOC126836785 isoform X2 [Adelges cooleyi]|uniref:uncharacterized protein LOC126836785 isoform X2 n=1 Tax=Adelges cooleyi TaxID=133065 RepID=UPI00218024F5|nr:uncharacterized protein LOC126836785 isoform X2 [Adelges cooleyi]